MEQGSGHEVPRAFRVEERRSEILRLLSEGGSVTVDQLCEEFGVSAVTVRADLSALERRGSLRRVHGGALPPERAQVVVGINERMSVNVEAKQRIGALASQLVEDGDSLIVDSGSTAMEFLKQLTDRRKITVVTHDLSIATYAELNMPESQVVVLGGALRSDHGYCAGPITLATIANLYVDKAFLGTNSFAFENGFMTENAQAAAVKSAFLEHARHRVMLMDVSKVGLHNFVRFGGLEDFEFLVMDEDPGQRMERHLSNLTTAPELLLP